MAPNSTESNETREFEKAGRQKRPSLFAELFAFLAETGKWWLVPIVVTLLLIGAFLVLSGSAGPFIYTLF